MRIKKNSQSDEEDENLRFVKNLTTIIKDWADNKNYPLENFYKI